MHKKLEVILKIFGLVAIIIGAWQAYLGYLQNAKLQAMRALHQEQIETCKDLVNTSSALFVSNNMEDYRKAIDEFAKIKHSNALVFLDAATIDKAVEVYNSAVELLAHDEIPDLRKKIRCSLGNLPFELAISCRKMVSEAFKAESEGSLIPLSESYTMGWAGSCPET